MTVKPIFKISFGRSAFGQQIDKNFKWGFHCNVQTEAAPLTVSFVTTHPIIRFTWHTPLLQKLLADAHSNRGRICSISLPSLKPMSSLQGREPCLSRSSFFSLKTITSLEQLLLYWLPPVSCQQETLLLALTVTVYDSMGPLYTKDNKYFSTSETCCYEFLIQLFFKYEVYQKVPGLLLL
jgi:hypothetical protein